MITWPQLVRLIAIGLMKSFNWLLKASEHRVLTIIAAEVAHSSAWKSSRRSICASPNVRGPLTPDAIRPSELAARIGEVLIVPVAQGNPPQSGELTSGPLHARRRVSFHVRPEMSARARPG